MSTKGILSGWHNVTTNVQGNVNGVTVEDILSILKTIKESPEYVTWKEALDYLYEHVVDRENPHHVTSDQLKTTVIQLIYEAWLMEGYAGDLSFFIDLLYRYIEYADDEIMNLEVSEDHVPPVDVLARYIESHNTNQDAHEDKINALFPGELPKMDHALSFRKISGMSLETLATLDPAEMYYEDILVQSGWMPDEFAFVLSFRFLENTIFQFHSTSGNMVVRLTSHPSQGNIMFTRCVANDPNAVLVAPIDSDLTQLPNVTIDYVTIPNYQAVVKCALIGNKSKLTYVLYTRSMELRFSGTDQIIEVDVEGIPTQVTIPTRPHPPKNARISFIQMEDKNILTDLVYYPEALTIEQLLHVYEWLDGNFVEPVVVYEPGDPALPVFTEQPVDPSEPSTAPVVFLTAGTLGKLAVSSTAEKWRDLLAPSMDDFVSILPGTNGLWAATKNGEIYFSGDEGTSWALVNTIPNVHINKMVYSEGYFVVVGTYDIYTEDSNGVILVTDAPDTSWTVTWEDWGPQINDACFGSDIRSYYKDLMMVTAHDNGRLGYIEYNYIYDYPYDEQTDQGPNGLPDYKCVAYGNGLYIAAGTGAHATRAESSPWNWATPIQVGSDPTITWRKIFFIGPEFVMIGDGGYVTTTIDGITWTDPVQLQPLADAVACAWVDLVYEYDKTVLVGNSGRTCFSDDFLSSWSVVKTLGTNDLRSVCTQKHRDIEKEYLFALENNNKIWSSRNMVDWVSEEINLTITWYHLIAGNGTLVMCGSGGYVSYSEDNGETWSDPFNVGTSHGLQLAEFYDGYFYLIDSVGNIYRGTTGRDLVYLSTLPDCGFVGYAYFGLSSNGSGTLICAFGNYYYRSTDNGATWAKIVFSAGYWVSSAYGNGKFLLVGMAGRVSYSVNDGAAWSAVAQPLGTLLFNDCAFGNGKFVAVTSTNQVAVSSDCVTWAYSSVGTGAWSEVIFQDGRFIISNGSQMSESLDGVSWSALANTAAGAKSIQYLAMKYMYILSGGQFYRGPSPATMAIISTIAMEIRFHTFIFGYGDAESWMKGVYAIALAQGGMFSYLEGGYGWTDVYMSFPHPWTAGMFCGNRWLLAASDGAVVVTWDENGWDWSNDPVIYDGMVWNTTAFKNATTLVMGDGGYYLVGMEDAADLSGPYQLDTKDWIQVLHDGIKFVALSRDGFVVTMTDAPVWNALIDTGLGPVLGFCHGDGKYVVLLADGRISVSADLVIWSTPQVVDASHTWKKILYGKDKFILYAEDSAMAISETTKRWRQYPASSTPNFMDVKSVPLIILPEVTSGGEVPV